MSRQKPELPPGKPNAILSDDEQRDYPRRPWWRRVYARRIKRRWRQWLRNAGQTE